MQRAIFLSYDLTHLSIKFTLGRCKEFFCRWMTFNCREIKKKPKLPPNYFLLFAFLPSSLTCVFCLHIFLWYWVEKTDIAAFWCPSLPQSFLPCNMYLKKPKSKSHFSPILTYAYCLNIAFILSFILLFDGHRSVPGLRCTLDAVKSVGWAVISAGCCDITPVFSP